MATKKAYTGLVLVGPTRTDGCDRQSSQFRELAEELQALLELGNLNLIRSRLTESIGWLRSCADSVEHDETASVEQMQRELHAVEGRLHAAENQAATDWLTGLANRREAEELMVRKIQAGQAFCIMLFDLDNFKRVNDQHGHGAGDEVLRLIAHTIHGALRKEDVLARYGGDEFVVLARETPLVGARSLGDRVRKAVERTRISWQGQALALTVSVGATVAGGQARYEAGRTEREVLEAADRALYQAKESGRNCVVATALPATG